ncbi:MAG: magnesium/cobalt efflux protein [Gammaproteobacteria bacterium RIFCSPHIGHO2_12_FULL_41_15]|nr:MAG: magnesium/cobalt efflux protein [Gammaproteobacteria bacterium RIFCSPHIGHO2_12_FULL_41_15]
MTQERKPWIERFADALLREPKDQEQLLMLLRNCNERRLIDSDTLNMLESVMHLSDLQVRDVMFPRAQAIMIDEEASIADALPIIIESTHSRFPVISSNKEDVIGILHAKELLKFALQPHSRSTMVKELVRPATFVPESKRLDQLLREIRNKRTHMLVVVDEYGGVAGLVTMEDILEQIVGDINDEYDNTCEINIKKIDEHLFNIRALTTIEEFNQYFNTQLSNEDFDTIGGYVMHELGHFPQLGEIATIDHFEFEILRVEARRIESLQVKKI